MTQIWAVPVCVVHVRVPAPAREGQVSVGINVEYDEPEKVERMFVKMRHGILTQAPAGHKFRPSNPSHFLMSITMPCGHEAMIKDIDEIPRRNVSCPCGDPSHYVVLYRQVQAQAALVQNSSTWP